MEFSAGLAGREREIVSLVTSAFTDSEGAGEGKSVGGLAKTLLDTTPDGDLFVYAAHEGPALVGCIFFSRLRYDRDDRTVFIMAPVAVRTDRQGQGIGQQLIAHGLAGLRRLGIDIVMTYGDPDFYSRVGFRQISEDIAQAPFKLTCPHGWLGQSLTGGDIQPLSGPPCCVDALNRPEYW